MYPCRNLTPYRFYSYMWTLSSMFTLCAHAEVLLLIDLSWTKRIKSLPQIFFFFSQDKVCRVTARYGLHSELRTDRVCRLSQVGPGKALAFLARTSHRLTLSDFVSVYTGTGQRWHDLVSPFVLNFCHNKLVFFLTFQCPTLVCPMITVGLWRLLRQNFHIYLLVGSFS